MSEHVVKKSLYYTIFGALLLCTALTIAVAYVDLGNFNIVVAMLIAMFKGALVVLFFMHVKYSSRMVKLYVVVGFSWLLLMIGITMTDYLSRSWLHFQP
jgi:cytochrome c oxidase subunit 4